MKVDNKFVQRLLEKYREIDTLSRVAAVLDWDLNVNLPPKGGEGRAAQSALITRLITERWLDPEFRKALEYAQNKGSTLESTEEAAIVRNLNHAGKFYWRVPKEIIVEFAETSSRAFLAWQEARNKDNFKEFLPHLKKMLRLNQIIAEHLAPKANLYDALLDLHEPGLTVGKCQKIFEIIQPELTKLVKKIGSKAEKFGRGWTDETLNFPIEDQRQLSLFVLKRMGYDLDAGRMDISSHPFTDTLDRYDIRITNRYDPVDFREALMVAMHEGGHALYEQGVRQAYAGTPLDGGVSLGIHESQSRFWENQVGRSAAFLTFMTPVFREFFPETLAKIETETLVALFNQVKPSLIRTEADEVTYNLHIALRFELEEALINSKLKTQGLPEIWREKMKKYLGVVPKTDREGVLQDVHWSHGLMGYFPTYTLGNLYAAQFTAKMKKDLPPQAGIDLEALAERGELGTILSWLRSEIHQYGSLYWPKELIVKMTGEELNPQYFLSYLKEKYSKIYGI